MRTGVILSIFSVLSFSHGCGESKSEHNRALTERIAVEEELLDLHRENHALKKQFISLEHKKMTYFKKIEKLQQDLQQCRIESGPQPNADAQGANSATLFYTVKRGDTLWGISRKSGLSVGILRRINNIRGSNLKIGQRLRITP
jgi:LysM repeat protein